ncbi:hypothetical protein ACZ91_51645 [Streptomyces regensis]|nr:hypothetical protein ACZ91_51645 [Streptomyces regensis]
MGPLALWAQSAFACSRYLPGVTPNSLLNACESAYGLPYPVSRATVASGASESRSRVAARVRRHQVRYAMGGRPTREEKRRARVARETPASAHEGRQAADVAGASEIQGVHLQVM